MEKKKKHVLYSLNKIGVSNEGDSTHYLKTAAPDTLVRAFNTHFYVSMTAGIIHHTNDIWSCVQSFDRWSDASIQCIGKVPKV